MEAYDVRQLPEEGAELDEDLPAAWLDEALSDPDEPEELALTARGVGHVHLSLSPIESHGDREVAVRVHGLVRAPLKARCVRCLTDLEFEVESPIEVTLLPPAASAANDEDEAPKARASKKKQKKAEKVEIRKEALDEGTYRDHLIDLPNILREAILLGLEMNPSCPDVGACSARTAALVDVVNGADSAPAPSVDPRWADLMKLRSKSS